MRKLSPLWIGFAVLVLIAIFTHTDDWLVPVLLFIILVMGIALQEQERKLNEYYEKVAKEEEEKRRTRS